mgnify:CR=1 FL=1
MADTAHLNAADRLRWVGAFALAAASITPACAGFELFPFWDMDPGRRWIPSTGFSPLAGLWFAVAACLGAAAILLADTLQRRPVPLLPPALGVLGAVGVLLHGRGPSGLEDLVHAAPWIAGVAAWIGATQLCRDAAFRRLILALLVSFVTALLAKGLLQILVEHPATIADYKTNRDAILASRGWTPGSPNALAYERRLSQPEASGWFALSNVYASFAAAAFAGLAAAVAATWRGPQRTLLAAGLGSLAAGAALVLSASKGGLGAALLGLAATGLLALLARRAPELVTRASRWAGPLVIAAVLALVAARGVVGESLGERSLLFRAFYAVGSLRIWADHPITGVGPAGFQDAYASAKPPISPETVVSPHSVLLDWTATLGLFGLAWAALLFTAARRTGAVAPPATDAVRTRGDLRFLVLVAAIATIGGAAAERALATPEASVARLVGLVGWIGLALGVHRALLRGAAVAWAGTASGLVLLAHAQIEVTPVWTNAAALFGLWVGAASACDGLTPASPRPAPNWRRVAPVACSLGLLAPIVWPIPGVARWQAALRDAAEAMRPVGEAALRLETLSGVPGDPVAEQLAAFLALHFGASVPARPEALAQAVDYARRAALDPAAEGLARALTARPGHQGTRAALARLELERAARTPASDAPGRFARLGSAVAIADSGVSINPGSPGAWDWLATVCERAAEMAPAADPAESPGDAWRRRAVEAWEHAAGLSPYATRPAVRLMALAAARGDGAAAGRWATEALFRDDLCRLDPLAGLTAEEREAATSLARP